MQEILRQLKKLIDLKQADPNLVDHKERTPLKRLLESEQTQSREKVVEHLKKFEIS